jgi:predicted transcriptional regulator
MGLTLAEGGEAGNLVSTAGRIRREESTIAKPARVGYAISMTVELPRTVEEELRALAVRQGRDVIRLVEDAVRDYLEAAAITDVDEAAVAEVQAKLVGELRGIPGWKGGRA